MFELISGLVQFLADALAQNDASLVQEHVTLHRFEPEFTKPVTFALSPHAETSLQQQPAQLGQTSLLIRARKSRNKICTNTTLTLKIKSFFFWSLLGNRWWPLGACCRWRNGERPTWRRGPIGDRYRHGWRRRRSLQDIGCTSSDPWAGAGTWWSSERVWADRHWVVICVQGWFGTGEGRGCSRPPDDATLPTVGCFDSRNCTESAGLPSRRKKYF